MKFVLALMVMVYCAATTMAAEDYDDYGNMTLDTVEHGEERKGDVQEEEKFQLETEDLYEEDRGSGALNPLCVQCRTPAGNDFGFNCHAGGWRTDFCKECGECD